MEFTRKERPIFGKDIPWKDVREKMCRVIEFTQLAKVENGKVIAIDRTTPYGFLTVECEGLSGEAIIWVGHRLDFLHLWEAFGQRDEAKGEEVIVVPLPHKWNPFLPILLVWLLPKDGFKKTLHPELREKTGRAGALELMPIAEWKEGVQEPK